ncbi:MAG: ABC transporter substrate-binding protein [Chitinophagales bacterium]
MKHLFAVLLLLLTLAGNTQVVKPGTYKIGLILPFQTYTTANRIEEIKTAHDVVTAHKIKINEDAIASLDFYEGLLQSLESRNDSFKIELYAYDCWNSDSVTKVILKKPELKSMDVIIGAMNTATAKTVADFCKQNKIINVQPFSPSKSLTADNPYHIKLAPTIDSHVDNMFLSIVDSFPGANIIIYTSNQAQDKSVAARFDSLFKDYNKTATTKFTPVLLNTSTMMVNGKKTTASEQLKAGKKNVWIITSFEESFVNGNFRVLYSLRDKYDIVAYGMPTWLNGDILRLDYVNDYQTRISDPFYADTFRTETRDFITAYNNLYAHNPSREAYLGFDVANFLLDAVNENGKDFLAGIATQRYRGAGYTFDIGKNYNKAASSLPSALSETVAPVNFYENRHVNIYRVVDYQLRRVF